QTHGATDARPGPGPCGPELRQAQAGRAGTGRSARVAAVDSASGYLLARSGLTSNWPRGLSKGSSHTSCVNGACSTALASSKLLRKLPETASRNSPDTKN